MDGPSFGEFCIELTTFYMGDDVKPALHTAYLPPELVDPGQNRSKPARWYIAVHRYPGRAQLGVLMDMGLDEFPAATSMQRFIPMQVNGASFGTALFQLWKEWVSVRNVNACLEAAARNAIYNQRREASLSNRRRNRLANDLDILLGEGN